MTRVVVLAFLLVLGASPARGQADSLDTRLQRAIAQYDRGDREGANREFARFVEIYNTAAPRLTSRDLAAVAVACSYLGAANPQRFRDALRAYDQAIAKDPDNLDARVGLGELFLEKYNSADARRTLAAALARNPGYVPALVAEARRRSFDGERGADSLVVRALSLQPEHVGARVQHARFLADAEDYAGARREIERVLAAHPDDAPSLAFSAALRRVSGDSAGYAAIAARYAQLYPRDAGVQVAAAELLSRVRQYAAAATAAREGTQRDPSSWRAHALLGNNLLRLGDVAAAKRSLETAFAGDPFDVWTKNTLDLLDTFSNYDELSAGGGRFRLVIEKTESDVLSLYLADLAERAHATFSRRYGFTPSGPVRVEVYRSHADFSVRTVGLAGLGALGVSFGNTVAFDSPAAKDAGSFTWGSTAWHELAHTFTLGASDQRVPRWLSEGLSVYEERRARPGWGQHVSPAFLEAYKEGKLLPPSRLNDGFVRPSYPRQVIFSYYEASLVCELLARDWGEQVFVDMLRAYRDGFSTEQVVRRVLRTDPQGLDRRFEAYMKERFGTVLPLLETYEQQVDSARDLLRDDNHAAAIAVLQRAKAAFPEYGGGDGAYPLLAQAYIARNDRRAAADVQATMVTLGEASHDVYTGLAALQLALGDSARAMDALEHAIYVDPFQIADHEQLASLAAAAGDSRTTVRERRAVVALNPVDRAEALYRLAVAYRQAGDRANARHAVIRSLEVAPHFDRAQELLLALHEERTP